MLYSRADCKHSDTATTVHSTGYKDAGTPAAHSSSRYQQHTAELQQQHHAASRAPSAASQHSCSHTSSSSSSCGRPQQLRPPPVRYASNTSNLACVSRAGPGTLPQHTYHKWPGRGYPADETTCTCVLPRTSVLCRLLVAMTIVLVFVQAVSCGMFFCVTLPVSHSRSSFVDYQDLVSDLSAPALAAAKQPSALLQVQQQPLKAVPKLIPRVIHQTYRNGRLPASAKSFMRTWAEVNGESWQVRFYSDDAALTFVRREFPEYFEAYLNLPKDVERADFFRYMVVLRLGGAYADVDAECRQPLDSIIQPADTLLVGWDTEVSNATSAAATGLARQRLVANWFFVAAAGHPVLRELCDRIAHNAMSTFSKDAVRDTAERTGQGLWTDVVLRHALQHHAAKHDDPWKVRILPRVAFGVRPVGDDAALRPDTPGVVMLHHFMSSWQIERHRKLIQAFGPLLSWGRPSQSQQITEPIMVSNITHYPVSVAFNPPFTLMTDLVGLGDMQAAADVSAMITAHGTWQPGVAPYRKPGVVDALVGALAKHSQRTSNAPLGASPPVVVETAAHAGPAHAVSGTASAAAATDVVGTASAAEQAGRAAAAHGSSGSPAAGSGADSSNGSGAGHSPAAGPGPLRGGVLVDVGAGQGFFSLAAAARGHRVVAFEASATSLAAFKASVSYNGFQDLITVHNAALGATGGPMCLQQAEKLGCPGAAAAFKAATAASIPANASRGGSNSSSAQQDERELQAAVAAMQLRQRRGFPWVADGSPVSTSHSCCITAGTRLLLSDVLWNATDVAALRISAHGHEGFILQGGLEYLRRVHKPDVIYIEFWPAAMRAAGDAKPVALVQTLFDLGYTDIAHAGRVCDARWQNATQGLHLQGSYSPAARAALQQPTWCKLRPEQFNVLADTADASVPENVMFLLAQPGASTQPASNSGSSNADGSRRSSDGSSSNSDSISSGMSDSTNSSSGASSSNAAGIVSASAMGGSNAAHDSRPPVQPQQAAAAQVHVGALQQSGPVAPMPPSLVLAGSTSNEGASADGWQPQQPL